MQIENQWEKRPTSWRECIHSKFTSKEVQDAARHFHLTEVEVKCMMALVLLSLCVL